MNDFTWKGLAASTAGLLVESLPPVTRPPVRYQQLALPGRAGALTLLEGTDVYEPYIREVRAMPLPGLGQSGLHGIVAWLCGAGDVIFSHEPNRVQHAQILDQLDFVHAFEQQREGVIRFLCEPFKAQTPEEAAIIFSSSNPTITNPGDVIAWPELTINGSGSVAVTINGTRQAYKGLVAGRLLHVDCLNGLAYTRASEDPANANYNTRTPVITYGDFPWLSPGSNAVALEGTVTALTIRPRWRWL